MLYRSVRETLKHVGVCFLAVITAILILLPLYFAAVENARALSLKDRRMYAEKGFLQLIGSIDAANRLMHNLRGNQNLAKLAYARDGDLSTYVNLFRFDSSISFEPMLDDFIANILVQFDKNQILLLKNKSFDDKRNAYGAMFYYEDMDYTQWQTKIQQQQIFWPAQRVYFQGEGTMECITFNWRNQAGANDSVHLCALISAEKLKQSVGFYEIEGAFVYLMRNEQELLFSEGLPAGLTPQGGRALSAEGYESILVENQELGLTLVMGVPTGQLSQEAWPVTRMLMNYIFWALIAGCGISLLYGYFYFKPLRSLMAYLDERDIAAEKSNVFYQIQRAFRLLDETGETLRQNYRKMQKQSRAVAFEHAVSGLPPEEDERAALHEIPVLQERYRFLTILFVAGVPAGDRVAYNAAARAATARAIIEMRWPGCYVQKSTMNRLFAVLPFEEVTPALLEDMGRHLAREFGSMLQIGISPPHAGLDELYAAYEESERAALTAEPGGIPNPFMAQPMKKELGTVLFVQYKELVDQLRAGNCRRVAEIFALLREVAVKQGLNSAQRSLLFSNTRAAVEAAMAYSSVEHKRKMPEFDQYAPGTAAIDGMKEFALAVCEEITVRRSQYHHNQIGQILRYIEENYRDSSLSLQRIAEHFSVTESYLSQYIKEHTGRNYTAHLEDVRMEEAMRLLTQTSLTIDEISRKVGYEYKNTFYKSFKRHYKEPPNFFRKPSE